MEYLILTRTAPRLTDCCRGVQDPRLLFGLYGLIIIAAEFAMCEGNSRANLFREGRAHVGTRVSPTSAESPTTNWNGSIPVENG
jgi:hypothetical protein